MSDGIFKFVQINMNTSCITTNAFRNLEYNIEKAPADLIILQSKGLNLADIFYCVGLRDQRD